MIISDLSIIILEEFKNASIDIPAKNNNIVNLESIQKNDWTIGAKST
jgi:hypothetical protein